MNNFMKKISEFSDHCNRQTEEAGLCCREEEILGDRLIISSGLFTLVNICSDSDVVICARNSG